MTLWKIYSMEDEFPGLWRQWYRHQCVAVGFNPSWGCRLRGKTKDFGGWRAVRARLLEVAVGDFIIVALKGNRVGRLGVRDWPRNFSRAAGERMPAQLLHDEPVPVRKYDVAGHPAARNAATREANRGAAQPARARPPFRLVLLY